MKSGPAEKAPSGPLTLTWKDSRHLAPRRRTFILPDSSWEWRRVPLPLLHLQAPSPPGVTTYPVSVALYNSLYVLSPQ